MLSCKCICREVILKGKTQYSWPPCTNEFKSSHFYIENIFSFFTKQATLLRRSTVLSLSISKYSLVLPMLYQVHCPTKNGFLWQISPLDLPTWLFSSKLYFKMQNAQNTLHFLCNLKMDPITKRARLQYARKVCQWKKAVAYCTHLIVMRKMKCCECSSRGHLHNTSFSS